MTNLTDTINESQLTKRKIIENFRLFDDIFFNICMTGSNEAVQYILRIILGMPDLTVADVRTQEMEVSLTERSVILDVLATDSNGRKFNIELQRSCAHAFPKRTRYIRSRIDSTSLDKGKEIQDLPDLYVVFITEEDYFHKNRPLYRFKMMNVEDHSELNDGAEVIYVNGSWDQNDEIGLLMNDFRVRDPSKMRPGILRDRALFFKTPKKEGERLMNEMMQEYFDQVYGRKIAEAYRQVEAANRQVEAANRKIEDANRQIKAEKLLASRQVEEEKLISKRLMEQTKKFTAMLLQSGWTMEDITKETALPLEMIQEIDVKSK